MLTTNSDHDKQTDLAWGGPDGESELKDEVAGAEMAKKEIAEAVVDPVAEAEALEAARLAEEEANQKTLDQYQAELAERRADLGLTTEIRKPNEGARTDKKWAAAKELAKSEEAAYFAGESKDKTRTRERKQKQIVEVDTRFHEAPRGDRPRGGAERGGRGGRGGDRGDRGGDRPARGGRGGAERGDRAPRGDRAAPRGDRAAPRPARPAGAAASVNITDEKAFPTLGA